MKVEVTKRELALGSSYIDKNNPRTELNYLLVDNINLVSTDTRSLAVVAHSDKQEEEFSFLVDRELIEMALKQRKAKYFLLEANSIMCLEENKNSLITFSKETIVGKFPEYIRIIPKEYQVKMQFHDESQINGLFAFQKVMADNKQIPKKLTRTDGEIFSGFVCVNERNLPVAVESADGKEKFIMMPVVDNDLFREDVI